jgi:probable rRNA maturation factor
MSATPADIDVEVDFDAWTGAMPDTADLAREAAIAGLGGLPGGLAVLLTDDDSVRALNHRFRGMDAATNVLAFPAASNPAGHLGDIALAFGVCDTEARAQDKTLADHLRHLVIHGVLHLLGYDHLEESEANRMEALERELLATLGVSDPYVRDVEASASLAMADAVRDG